MRTESLDFPEYDVDSIAMVTLRLLEAICDYQKRYRNRIMINRNQQASYYPLVSVIIPAYNAEIFIEETLKSVLSQTYENIEVLVVDDGSNDGTGHVCKGFNVHLLSHPYSKGNGAAIKTGARAATGDYIVFMDGDGQHDPAEIEKLIAKGINFIG